LNSGRSSLWLSATGAVVKRRAVVHQVKGVVALSFRSFGVFDRKRVAGLRRPSTSALTEPCQARRVTQTVSSLTRSECRPAPQTPLGRHHRGRMPRCTVTDSGWLGSHHRLLRRGLLIIRRAGHIHRRTDSQVHHAGDNQPSGFFLATILRVIGALRLALGKPLAGIALAKAQG
jgi:hypothetical protein